MHKDKKVAGKLEPSWKLNVGPSESYLDAVTTKAVDHGIKPAKAACTDRIEASDKSTVFHYLGVWRIWVVVDLNELKHII